MTNIEIGYVYDYEGDARHWDTTAEKLAGAYNLGKQEAEQEKQRNPTLFYLNELLRSMDAGGEWYGISFDVPMWIVKQVIALHQ